MDSATRQTEILGRLRVDGHVDVAALATSLGTSEMTIRRDLDTLAESGALRRVRGGAISLMTRGEELPFGLRAVEASATKGRMAAMVAGLLRDGEAVVVDRGRPGSRWPGRSQVAG